MKKLLRKVTKLYKKHRKQLLRFGRPVLAGAVVFAAGMMVQGYIDRHQHPANIVWTIDNSVAMPVGLEQALLKQDSCKAYRGADAPKGIGLWAVTQVYGKDFAKLTYGCSWSLDSHTLAVRQSSGWVIVSPSTYFANSTEGTPTCAAVVQYKVPLALEGFCMNDKGQLVKNPNPQ